MLVALAGGSLLPEGDEPAVPPEAELEPANAADISLPVGLAPETGALNGPSADSGTRLFSADDAISKPDLAAGPLPRSRRPAPSARSRIASIVSEVFAACSCA